MCVLHHCDVRACVRPDHLFTGTRGDNNRDAAAKGRNSKGRAHAACMHPVRGDMHWSRTHPEKRARGERQGHSKLTERQVREICSRIGQTQSELAKEFGMSQGAISRILSGERWAHVQ